LTEAEIVAVLVREGDVITEDAPLLEVETDKAQVEIPSPMGGRVEKIHVAPGQTVKVGAVLVTFADAGAPAQATASAGPRAAAPATPAPAGAPRRAVTQAAASPAVPAHAGGPVAATPSTRRLARELGVDLRAVRGRGPGGRILDADVRAAGAAVAPGVPGPTLRAVRDHRPVPVLAAPGTADLSADVDFAELAEAALLSSTADESASASATTHRLRTRGPADSRSGSSATGEDSPFRSRSSTHSWWSWARQ